MSTPSEPPPTYEQSTDKNTNPAAKLQIPQARNGIPPEQRRSMEDETRDLPPGWVRQYDNETHHQFFVDTNVNPPRSIWSHPLDDEEYLQSLTPAERERAMRLHHSVSLKDIAAESSDDEEYTSGKKKVADANAGLGSNAAGPSSATASSSQAQGPQPSGLHKYGRKLKDRITHSTHEERERDRQQRSREEEQAYQAHIQIRQAMVRAEQTGQPQYVGKDRQGHDVYLEPPNGPAAPGGARGYNPYSTGVYSNPNARFVRPSYPYSRPYGYGYGGGYGFPIAGGLLGGVLLGGLLF